MNKKEITVATKITITINGDSKEITREEAENLYQALKQALGKSDTQPFMPFVPKEPYYPQKWPLGGDIWCHTQHL